MQRREYGRIPRGSTGGGQRNTRDSASGPSTNSPGRSAADSAGSAGHMITNGRDTRVDLPNTPGRFALRTVAVNAASRSGHETFP
jgi:hypothetical protein